MNTRTDRGMHGVLQTRAEENPASISVIMNKKPISFGEIAKEADKVAAGLFELGIRKGDSVGLILPTSEDWVYAFWGILKAGAVAVPLAPGTGKAELVNIFSTTEVKVCIAVSRFQANIFTEIFAETKSDLPLLNKVFISGDCGDKSDLFSDFGALLNSNITWNSDNDPAVGENDCYALLSTSGSTGTPKITPKLSTQFIKWLDLYAEEEGFSSQDIMYTPMPPFHALSMAYLIMSSMLGATYALVSTFDPDEMLDIIAEYRVNKVLFSATNAKMLLASTAFADADLSSVESFTFSGEFCPDEVAAEFHEKRDFNVRNVMGSTEANAYLTWNSDRDKGHSVSVLTPLSFIELNVLGEDAEPAAVGERGEIFVNHGDILPEYYKNKEASEDSIIHSETGKLWFVTGDMAVPLPEGRYQFAGRKKRIIKRGATLIYPEEIEAFLMKHPDIQATAILKEEDEVKGEGMKAFVELKKGSALDVMDIIKYCQGELANNKIPDKIEIIDEIPRETGKMQFKKLRKA